MTSRWNNWRPAGICLLLALVTLAVYWPVTRHEFLNYDDQSYVYENPHVVRGITGQGLIWSFTHSYSLNWHPLTWLSHMLDVQLYGLQHPGGHHLTSLLFHLANTLLLFLVLRRMTCRDDALARRAAALWPSALVAALFALHPLHVESVAWVSERKDVLSAFFFLLTLWAYTRYAQPPAPNAPALQRSNAPTPQSPIGNHQSSIVNRKWYFLSLLFFTLGLMSKPMLVTVPFVLLLLDYWPLQRFPSPFTIHDSRFTQSLSPLLLEKAPFFLLSAASCVVTVLAQAKAMSSFQGLSLPLRISNALVAYADYLWQTVYPVGLAVFYPHPTNQLPAWKIVLSVLMLLALSTAALAGWRKRPWLAVGWFWFLGMLIPVIGLVQVGAQAKADRYTYLPQIGLCLALVWSVAHVAGSSIGRRRTFALASLLAVALLGMAAARQVAHWKNSETLWTHALTCTSRNYEAHRCLGLALMERGDIPGAISHYLKALEITVENRPARVEVLNTLGVAMAANGQTDQALVQFHRALNLNPDFPTTHYNLGLTLARVGKLDEALGHFQRALQLKPDLPEAHNNLGIVFRNLGRAGEAIHHYRLALQLRPDFADAHYNLALMLAGTGEFGEARVHFQRALQLKPAWPDAEFNLANVLRDLGSPAEALVHYRRVLELQPDHPQARAGLGLTLFKLGKKDEAAACFAAAFGLNLQQPDALAQIGLALAQSGAVAEAMDYLNLALQQNPGSAEIHCHLADALSQQGRTAEAITHYREALRLQPGSPRALKGLEKSARGSSDAPPAAPPARSN